MSQTLNLSYENSKKKCSCLNPSYEICFLGIVMPLCEVAAEVRERLRGLAREEEPDTKALQKKLLQLCDDMRDTLLPPLGVRLEDREGCPPSIKIVDPTELKREIEAKRAAEEAKRLEKLKKKEAAEAKKKEEQNKHMDVSC